MLILMLTEKCSHSPSMKPLFKQKETTTEFHNWSKYRPQMTMGCQVQSCTSIVQPLHLRLREHHRRRSQKVCNSQMVRISAVRQCLLYVTRNLSYMSTCEISTMRMPTSDLQDLVTWVGES